MEEFLGVPILIVVGAIGLALVTYLLDALEPGFVRGIRRFMTEHVFGDSASTATLLAAIATSHGLALMTARELLWTPASGSGAWTWKQREAGFEVPDKGPGRQAGGHALSHSGPPEDPTSGASRTY